MGPLLRGYNSLITLMPLLNLIRRSDQHRISRAIEVRSSLISFERCVNAARRPRAKTKAAEIHPVDRRRRSVEIKQVLVCATPAPETMAAEGEPAIRVVHGGLRALNCQNYRRIKQHLAGFCPVEVTLRRAIGGDMTAALYQQRSALLRRGRILAYAISWRPVNILEKRPMLSRR